MEPLERLVKIENGKVYLDNDKGYGLEDRSYFYESQGDAIDAHDMTILN